METNPVVAAPRPLGQLLKDSFAVFQAGLPDYAAVVAVAAVPATIVTAFGLQVAGLTDKAAVTSALRDSGTTTALIPVAIATVVSGLINAVGLIALVSTVAARGAGGTLPLGDAYKRAASLILRFLWTELLMGLWVLGGLVLLVVPGIILAIRYSLCHLALILEGRSGQEALDRSKQIVMGRAGKVVGNLLAASILVALASMLLDTALNLVLILPKALMPGAESFWGTQLEGLVHEILGGTMRVWVIALTVLLYQDLSAQAPAPAPLKN